MEKQNGKTIEHSLITIFETIYPFETTRQIYYS